MRAATLLCSLLASLAAFATPGVTHDLRVTLQPKTHRMLVSGTLTLAPADRPRSQLRFALTDYAESLRVEGTPRLERQAYGNSGTLSVWTLTPAVPFPAGEPVVIRFSYRIVTNVPRQKFYIGPEAAFAQGMSTVWYPMLDNALRDTGTMAFDVPAGYSVVATGSSGDGRTFRIDKPSAFSFAAARYRTARRGEVSVHLLEDRGPVEPLLDDLTAIVNVLRNAFGPSPYGTIAIAEIPGRISQNAEIGADTVENLVMIHGDYLATPLRARGPGLLLFAHEIAHQWWGNLVRRKSKDEPLFLNESMANYAAMLALEAIDGPAAAARFRRTGIPGYYDDVQNAAGYFRLVARGGDRKLRTFGDNAQELAKSKGFMIHTMLSEELGRDAYHAALREFLAGHAFSTASVEELFDQLKLRWFYEQWLDRLGAPDLSLAFTPTGGTITQTEPLYRLSIEVALSGEGQTAIRRVEVRERETAVTWDVPFKVEQAVLDPEYKVLRRMD